MIGPRVGVKCGPFGGGAVGISVDQLGPATAPSTTTLTATIVDATDPIIGGQNEVYTIQVTNTGSNTATSISVTVTLDASLTWVSQAGAGWTLGHSGQTVTATLASLAVGAATPITVTATTANVTASISTTIAVTCSNATTVNDSASTTVNKVSKDATSLIYVPAASAEWAALGLNAPADLWLTQEASGNLADSIGSVTLTANAAPSYSNAITGWTRVGVGFTEGTANQRITAASGTGPSPATTSIAFLMYAKITTAAAGAARGIIGLGSNLAVQQQSGFQKIRIACVGVNTNGTANYADGNVHPFLFVYDRTNTKVVVYTDLETFTGTYAAGALDGNKGYGAGGSITTPTGMNVLFGAAYTGANAEALSTQATAKSYLQSLGWTISAW